MLRRSTKTGPSSGGASPKQNVLLAIIISPKHPSLPMIPPLLSFSVVPLEDTREIPMLHHE